MKLLVDWKQAWTWFSMQAMGTATLLLGAWAAMPDDLKIGLPSWVVPVMAVLILILGMIGRITQQPTKG